MNASGPQRSRGRWQRIVILAALYLGGLVHWALFFGTLAEPLRGPSFTREDWRKEYRYASVLQQAVRQHVVPYYISRPIHTRRFLALPEVSWSPQVVLLRALAGQSLASSRQPSAVAVAL